MSVYCFNFSFCGTLVGNYVKDFFERFNLFSYLKKSVEMINLAFDLKNKFFILNHLSDIICYIYVRYIYVHVIYMYI